MLRWRQMMVLIAASACILSALACTPKDASVVEQHRPTQSPPRDYLTENCQRMFLSSGAEGVAGQEGRMLRLKYWNCPPTVRPGQRVRGRIAWETVSGNPNAVVFATIVGNWEPDRPIAKMGRDHHGRPGKQFELPFEFTAPKRPGRYRIRWIFPMAFKSIDLFYSKPDHGSSDPGNAWWSEVDFVVAEW